MAYVSTSTISKLLPPSLSSTELPGAVAIYGSWLASASCDGKVLPLSTSWAAEYSCTIDPVSVGFTTVSTITRGQTLSVSYLIKKTPLLLNVNPSGATTLPMRSSHCPRSTSSATMTSFTACLTLKNQLYPI